MSVRKCHQLPTPCEKMPCNEHYYPWNSSQLNLVSLGAGTFVHRGLGVQWGVMLFSWHLTTKPLTQTLQKKSKAKYQASHLEQKQHLMAQPASLPTICPSCSAAGYPRCRWGGCTVCITNAHEWGVDPWNSGNVSQPETKSLKRITILLWEMLFS